MATSVAIDDETKSQLERLQGTVHWRRARAHPVATPGYPSVGTVSVRALTPRLGVGTHADSRHLLPMSAHHGSALTSETTRNRISPRSIVGRIRVSTPFDPMDSHQLLVVIERDSTSPVADAEPIVRATSECFGPVRWVAPRIRHHLVEFLDKRVRSDGSSAR